MEQLDRCPLWYGPESQNQSSLFLLLFLVAPCNLIPHGAKSNLFLMVPKVIWFLMLLQVIWFLMLLQVIWFLMVPKVIWFLMVPKVIWFLMVLQVIWDFILILCCIIFYLDLDWIVSKIGMVLWNELRIIPPCSAVNFKFPVLNRKLSSSTSCPLCGPIKHLIQSGIWHCRQ